jgi:hypothetical protein
VGGHYLPIPSAGHTARQDCGPTIDLDGVPQISEQAYREIALFGEITGAVRVGNRPANPRGV